MSLGTDHQSMYFKSTRSQKIIIKVSFRSENSQHVFDNIKMIKNGILNKCHDKNQRTYTSNSLRRYILEFLLYKIVMIIILMDVFYHNPFQ